MIIVYVGPSTKDKGKGLGLGVRIFFRLWSLLVYVHPKLSTLIPKPQTLFLKPARQGFDLSLGNGHIGNSNLADGHLNPTHPLGFFS